MGPKRVSKPARVKKKAPKKLSKHFKMKAPRCNQQVFIFIDPNNQIYADDQEHLQPSEGLVFVAANPCQVYFQPGNNLFPNSPYPLVSGENQPPLKPQLGAQGQTPYAINGPPRRAIDPIIVVP